MYFFVFTTTDNKRIAKTISEEILKSGFSPCVQTDENVSSIYKWKNKIKNAHEIRLNIKTHKKYIGEVIQIIKKNHNYEVPEIVTSQFDINDDNYKKWFDNNLRRET